MVTVLCLWLWLRGGRGRLVVVGLWGFFFFRLLWRFLDLEFVGVVAVDVVAVVDDKGEEIIYYFNV